MAGERETTDEQCTCRNCAQAFGRVPCTGRDFRQQPRCPRDRSWVPLGYLFQPLSDEERLRIIDEELERTGKERGTQ